MHTIIGENIYDIRNLWSNINNNKLIYSYFGNLCKTLDKFLIMYPNLAHKKDKDIFN